MENTPSNKINPDSPLEDKLAQLAQTKSALKSPEQTVENAPVSKESLKRGSERWYQSLDLAAKKQVIETMTTTLTKHSENQNFEPTLFLHRVRKGDSLEGVLREMIEK